MFTESLGCPPSSLFPLPAARAQCGPTWFLGSVARSLEHVSPTDGAAAAGAGAGGG